jgi:hypothetical protein
MNTTNAPLESLSGRSTETQTDSMRKMQFTRQDVLQLTLKTKIILTSTVTVTFKKLTRTELLVPVETILASEMAITLLDSRSIMMIVVKKQKSYLSVVLHGFDSISLQKIFTDSQKL